MLTYLATKQTQEIMLFIRMWGIVTRLWSRQSGPIPHKYRRFFTSTKHSDWYRDQPSLIFNVYQFSVWWKSGCSIRYLTTHLHLELQLRITVLKLFLPVHDIVTSSRKLQLYLYWPCASKLKVHSTVVYALAKPNIRDHSMTQHFVILGDR